MTLLNDADKIFLGSSPVSRVYVGSEKIWPDVFDPASIPDLGIWLDATQITGKADLDPVPVWEDASPTGRDANRVNGNAVYRSAGINGHPSLRFGQVGLTDMKIDPLHAIGDRTVFQIVQTLGSSVGAYHTTVVQELAPYFQTYGTPGGTIHSYANPDIDSGVPWSGLAQQITSWWKGAASQQWLEVDGHQVTSAWTAGSTNSWLYIGGFTPGSYGLNGFIGEILIYERCLTDAERGQVQDYLRSKWGL